MTHLPHELQTFLTIISGDLRIAAARIPREPVRDPYTGEITVQTGTFSDRLLNHANQCERYADTITRASAAAVCSPGDQY